MRDDVDAALVAAPVQGRPDDPVDGVVGQRLRAKSMIWLLNSSTSATS